MGSISIFKIPSKYWEINFPVWPTLWAIFLSLGWLLPNHYLPWIAFHTDAWISWVFATAAIVFFIIFRPRTDWTVLAVTVAFAALIPFFQYGIGLLPFSGQAWIASAYLIGFFLSLIFGASWDRVKPNEAIPALFLAIFLAAVCSVGIQLYQWMGLSGNSIWIVYMAGNRPFGNLVQPNQLATFLSWGLISVGWFSYKKKIGLITSLSVAMFFLLGISLTQSRTAMLAICFFLVASWYWRKLWFTKNNLWILIFLISFYVFCILVIGPISNFMHLDQSFDPVERITGSDIRLSAYKLFADAIFRNPFLGYGWTNLGPVQISVAENHVELGGVFQQSHNLFIDLILWSGLPIGLLISGVLVFWFFKVARRVSCIDEALLVLFVGVFWWHAMLELPHQYAYLLFPVGFVMGSLDFRTASLVLFRTHYAVIVFMLVYGVCVLGLVTRDYLRMEADFQALRFERSYGVHPPEVAPKTLVASQLEAFIEMGRFTPKSDMSMKELDWVRETTNIFPSPANQYSLIASLVINDKNEQAYKRMRILQKIMSESEYKNLGDIWVSQGKTNSKIASVQWLPMGNRLP